MNIFRFDDYKDYAQARLKRMPHQGRGQLKKIAAHLRVPPSAISQVLGGRRDFTLEQAHGIADYLGLDQRESEYFYWLVQKNRAGTDKLRSFSETQLSRIKHGDREHREKRNP